MTVSRGDVGLTYVPNVGSPGGKARPALIVQSDHNNARLNETIIAAITSNTSRSHGATQLLVDTATPDGVASGLLHDSAVRCERLHSIPQVDVRRVIGRLSEALMQEVDGCLKSALGIVQITLIRSRAMDNLLRAYFASPEVRAALLGAKQDPEFGILRALVAR